MPEQSEHRFEDAEADALLFQELQKKIQEAPGPHPVGSVQVQNGIVTVFLRGLIIDEGEIQNLGSILFEIADHPMVEGVVIDCANVRYLSSAAFGKHITTHQKLRARTKPRLGMSNTQVFDENLAITQLNRAFHTGGDHAYVMEKLLRERQKIATAMQGKAKEAETP